ncbi:hypothetical protein L596_006483 [Steinernema carpocapsae]|uniref:WAPL domain-containing protein n=1 Tax=Steinernema carpocapsae TaxID=34508 RepID=A0A4U8V2G1_STECR|nr:hypothetical protein L596_006483 [Steinernema carpocapsae]
MSDPFGKPKDKASSLFDLAFKNKPRPKAAATPQPEPTDSSDSAVPSTSSKSSPSLFDFTDKDDVKPPVGASKNTASLSKRVIAMELDDVFPDSPEQKKVRVEAASATNTVSKRSRQNGNSDEQEDAKRMKDTENTFVPCSTEATSSADATQGKRKFFVSNRPRPTYNYRPNWGGEEPKMPPSPVLVTAPRPPIRPRSQQYLNAQPMVLPGRGAIRFTIPPDFRPSRAAAPIPAQKIRNVRDPSQMLQSGQYDDFRHDLEYFMESINESTTTDNVKRLCLVQMTKKCISPEFRQFLRSRNTLNVILIRLQNDRQDPGLNLALSCFLFMMLRESGVVPFEAKALSCISSLLKTAIDESLCDDLYKNTRHQCWKVIQEWHSSLPHKDQRFDVPIEEYLTAPHLVLEALGSIVSWKGEYVSRPAFPKEELLSHGILQWMADKIDTSVQELIKNKIDDEDKLVAIIAQLNRSFRIIEYAIEFHKKNQAFMINHRSNLLVQGCTHFFRFSLDYLKEATEQSEIDEVVLNCLESCSRAILNLSHGSELCAKKFGDTPEFLHNAAHLYAYVLPKFADKAYDLRIMMSSVLINLVERSKVNCEKVRNMTLMFYVNKTEEEDTCLQGLTKLFLYHEASARTIDEDLDRDLIDANEEEADESEEDDGRLKRPQEMTEGEMLKSVQEAMNKASLHMEDSVCASYVALLVGCLIQHDRDAAMVVKDLLPDKSFHLLIDQLRRFFDFMREANKGVDANGSLLRIIKVLEGYEGGPNSD